MNFLARSLTLFLLCLVAAAPAIAATINSVTDGGVPMTLDIDSPITTQATAGLICVGSTEDLTEAKIWLVTDGGQHQGSTPTTIVSAGNNCFRVNAINFFMPGDWQMRIKLANGDRGMFKITVME